MPLQRSFFENASEIKMRSLNMAVFRVDDQRWSVRVTLRGNNKKTVDWSNWENKHRRGLRVYRRESSDSGREMEEWKVPEISLAVAAYLYPLKG